MNIACRWVVGAGVAWVHPRWRGACAPSRPRVAGGSAAALRPSALVGRPPLLSGAAARAARGRNPRVSSDRAQLREASDELGLDALRVRVSVRVRVRVRVRVTVRRLSEQLVWQPLVGSARANVDEVDLEERPVLFALLRGHPWTWWGSACGCSSYL